MVKERWSGMIDCKKKCVHYPVCFAYDDICGEFEECVYYEEKRPHGEWELTDNRWGVGTWRCTNCNSYYDIDTNYCPTCGADMRKEGEEK